MEHGTAVHLPGMTFWCWRKITADVRSPVLQDHFENLYAVVSGVKFFYLLPPSDAYRMSMKRYPLAQYERNADRRLELQLKEPAEVNAFPALWALLAQPPHL